MPPARPSNCADLVDVAAAAIEASLFGTIARESSWAYPLANLVHLLGMVLLIGGIGIVDLRLIGAFPSLPLVALSRYLTPLALTGLGLMLLTGPVLFAADATALVKSATFAWKLALIGVALINALAFRWLWRGSSGEPVIPLRLMALASLGLWLWIASLGRLIAYR